MLIGTNLATSFSDPCVHHPFKIKSLDDDDRMSFTLLSPVFFLNPLFLVVFGPILQVGHVVDIIGLGAHRRPLVCSMISSRVTSPIRAFNLSDSSPSPRAFRM